GDGDRPEGRRQQGDDQLPLRRQAEALPGDRERDLRGDRCRRGEARRVAPAGARSAARADRGGRGDGHAAPSPLLRDDAARGGGGRQAPGPGAGGQARAHPRCRAADRGARRGRRRLPARRSAADAPEPRRQSRLLLRHGAVPRARARHAAPGHQAAGRRGIRQAHPGPAHARAGCRLDAREAALMSAQRRRLAIVAALAILGLAGVAVWRLVLAPPALPPGKLAATEAQLAQADAAYAQAKWDREAMTRLFKKELVAEQEAQRAQRNEEAQAAVVAAQRRQVEAARGALTAAKANLVNPAIRSSQVAAVQGQILQAKADIAAAQAEAERARAQLQEARAHRKDLRVIAPFNGTVATRTAEPGEVVMAGTAIITLVNLGEVYLRAFVPEGQIGRVRVDQPARVYLDSAPTKPIEAYVMRIDPRASFTPENTYFREDRVKQV